MQLAEALGVSVEDVERAEAGPIPAEQLVMFERFFNLKIENNKSKTTHSSVPVSNDAHGTVFLFHGNNQDFYYEDLVPLAQALEEGRRWLNQPGAAAGLERRMGIAPVPVAGPKPGDAARQGYRLAQQVRQMLGNNIHPIDSMWKLAKNEFSIHIEKVSFKTRLRAAAIHDVQQTMRAKAAAAAAISEMPIPMMRLAIAHELCHLLFDEKRSGVQIVLDSESTIETRKKSLNELLESRAKGFAAEFLLPIDGMRQYFVSNGDKEIKSSIRKMSLQDQLCLIAGVSDFFCTPMVMTIYHIYNHNLIGLNCRCLLMENIEEINFQRKANQIESNEIIHILGSSVNYFNIYDSFYGDKLNISEINKIINIISTSRQAWQDQKPMLCSTIINNWIYEKILNKDISNIEFFLKQIDLSQISPPAITGMVMTTRDCAEQIDREALIQRAVAALRETHRWEEERIRRAMDRLR